MSAATPSGTPSGTFRSFRHPNYRRWYAGAVVSNVGTWMQRTAQSWLVFAELTDHDTRVMGVVMALQFAPQLLLAPYAGVLVDRADRRRLLVLTQTVMATLALVLGVLIVTGLVTLPLVMAFALALGITTTFDAPARQTFVSQLVEDKDLSNAVALNSTSFNLARLVGPAVAGVLVAAVGSGWVFLLNSLSFAAMLAALWSLDRNLLRASPRASRGRGQIREGFAYVLSRPDLTAVLLTVFLLGTFGLNFAVYLAAMAGTEFGRGPDTFGLLNSVLAAGTLAGALLSAHRPRARLRMIFLGSAGFAVCTFMAAMAPTLWIFAAWLVPTGLSALTVSTTANAYVQTTTDAAVRGRVMSLYMAIFMGGTPLGAPLVGWITSEFGPRWGLGSAVFAGLAGVTVGAILWWRWARHLTADRRSGRYRTAVPRRPRDPRR
ncbi:MFS transporter [Kocuria sp. JC486]|uniref:MFS transporter n=1 Tax=Kocuria soli TaxID=2485125 RepID=A0A3N3ZM33_9MICC|nr:MFS transporter [Kocuria soli]NHU85244.1 MFS transporter [Kocuria sp. JC486]ROZ61683.1 MFS transporter [Kocuria soli]